MINVERVRELLLEIQSRLDRCFDLLGGVDAVTVAGRMSWFGGPDDMGVAPDEGLALCEKDEVDKFDEDLFLDEQPPGTTGLARRLNPDFAYIAMRWDYDVTSRDWLQAHAVVVRNPRNGRIAFEVQPIDWGPHQDTGRVADLSPGLLRFLDLETDEEVEITVPVPAVAVV